MYCICICGISWVRVDTGLFSSDLSFNHNATSLSDHQLFVFIYLFIFGIILQPAY